MDLLFIKILSGAALQCDSVQDCKHIVGAFIAVLHIHQQKSKNKGSGCYHTLHLKAGKLLGRTLNRKGCIQLMLERYCYMAYTLFEDVVSNQMGDQLHKWTACSIVFC